MKNNDKITFWTVPALMIMFGMAAPASNPWWIKPLVLAITILLQIIIFSIFFWLKQDKMEKES